MSISAFFKPWRGKNRRVLHVTHGFHPKFQPHTHSSPPPPSSVLRAPPFSPPSSNHQPSSPRDGLHHQHHLRCPSELSITQGSLWPLYRTCTYGSPPGCQTRPARRYVFVLNLALTSTPSFPSSSCSGEPQLCEACLLSERCAESRSVGLSFCWKPASPDHGAVNEKLLGQAKGSIASRRHLSLPGSQPSLLLPEAVALIVWAVSFPSTPAVRPGALLLDL